MANTNTKQIINKASTNTTALQGGGILLPEQSSQFLKQVMDSTPLLKAVRHVMRKSRKGEIDKIGVGRRMLRSKVEEAGPNEGDIQSANFSKVPYSTESIRLDWDISEDSLRENIEGQNMDQIITDLMTAQVGVDTEDLAINGDMDYSGDTDAAFLKLANGWIKKLGDGAHIVDRSGIEGGAMGLGVFYTGLRAMPNKYHGTKLRWIMSPNRQAYWEEYLLNQAITAGGIVTDKRIENPAAIPTMACNNWPDDLILLTDPYNLIVVHTYNMKIRKDDTSKDAIRQDKKFYVIHFDADFIVEECDAAVLIKGLAPIDPSAVSASSD